MAFKRSSVQFCPAPPEIFRAREKDSWALFLCLPHASADRAARIVRREAGSPAPSVRVLAARRNIVSPKRGCRQRVRPENPGRASWPVPGRMPAGMSGQQSGRAWGATGLTGPGTGPLFLPPKNFQKIGNFLLTVRRRSRIKFWSLGL